MTRQEIEDRKNALASVILDREAKLKEHDYVSAKIADGNTQPTSPAADFAANINYDHELLKKGQWVLPDSDLLFDVIGGIEYPTTNDRNADVINRALKAIGASALGNTASVWSCSKCNAGNGWYANGNYGCAHGGILYFSTLTVPLVLLDVPQSAI